MPTATINSVATVAGISIQSNIVRTAASGIPTEKSLPKADIGELTTRTNDTDGEITMESAEHTIQTGDVIDIYWVVQTSPVQATAGIAYGATVGTVAGTAVPFTGASGDALPVLNSVVNVDEQIPLDIDFDGDKLEAIVGVSTKRGHVDFVDSTPTTLDEAELVANAPYQYVADCGQANPLQGNPVDQVLVSNGDATAEATFKLGVLYNSDE